MVKGEIEMKLTTTRVDKSWGYELIFINGEKYCGKKLVFNKGRSASYHNHRIKDECFYIQSGKLSLKYSFDADITKTDELLLEAGDVFHIPPGLYHQLYAYEDSEVMEFSTTDRPEDSYRIVKGN